jgi:hypothetical protein
MGALTQLLFNFSGTKTSRINISWGINKNKTTKAAHEHINRKFVKKA